MGKIKSNTVIALCTVILSLIWLYLGIFQYGLWDVRHGPMTGLFPTVIASVLLVVGIIVVIRSLKEKKTVYGRAAFEMMISFVLLLVASLTIGMLLSLLIYFVLWQILIEKTSIRTKILSTAVVSAIVLGVFVFWLKVPFENGILFDLIMY
ncbi:MAG TPA: tripartite tricarboxylate transporter TctB family protein [Syntrophomonas sp.]|nr:tripartite tricarboxylate transporter TctB family protein [Syntrophomonas sp.]